MRDRVHGRHPRRRGLRRTFLTAALLASPAAAGSSAERAILIVDPGNAESLYVANYYQAARALPASNVVYMAPGAASYNDFVATNVEGLFGSLANHCIEDQIDFVIIPPGGSFYIPASGFINDPCFPVNRFSVGSAYTLAFVTDDVLAGQAHSWGNRYWRATYGARAFDASVAWLSGNPSDSPNAKRYFIGGMLGYTGERGNTLEEILDLIDRSVAVDGTHPAGTFYYMETNDPARSGPRHGAYPTAVGQITGVGGLAEHLFANLPEGNQDCLGIMTGLASPDVDGADMTILPGAFCDHLTSFAGRFDTSSQVKMSRWIANGASGTAGTVEEPCNYSGKFNHAKMHAVYFKGLSLGEAWFRSVSFAPFQNLLYGDPLTRPFLDAPTVDVPGLPGTLSGVVTITPVAAATDAGASIESLELLVDGVRSQRIPDGASFTLDTTRLADGWHELRVRATDTKIEENAASWVGSVSVSNFGGIVGAGVSPSSGDLSTRFDFIVDAGPLPLSEIRLLHNGRVVAADDHVATTLSVYGQNLGAGPVSVQVEAIFDDGSRARSAPIALDVDYDPGTPAGALPVAFDFEKRVLVDTPFVLELPGAYAEDVGAATHTVVTPPTNASVISSGSGPYRILAPDPGAVGSDTLTYEVTTSAGTSALGTVTLVYGPVSPCAVPLGETYCSPAVANSSGLPGVMTVSGSDVVADDDLELVATQLPTAPNIGYFIMGTGQNTFVPPGSSGPICVSPGILRYLPPVQNTSELDGGFARAVGTSGPISASITPGSTWNFQAWHRDGMDPSNLTDAVSVTFQP